MAIEGTGWTREESSPPSEPHPRSGVYLNVTPRHLFTRYLALALGLALFALVGVPAYRYWLTTRPLPPAPPGMVAVSAGYFLLGANDPAAEPDEPPLRRVFLRGFYLDKYEVTNRDFARVFPAHTHPPDDGDLPVTNVLKPDAEAYAQAIGKRLPTGAEWEKGARGTDGRAYPWGNEFRPECANLPRRSPRTAREAASCALLPGHKLKGGSFPLGVSPYGAEDMAGNVWEWVADVHRDAGLFGLPLGPARGILRGGAYGYGPFQGRCSYQAFEDLQSTCHDTGFRCVKDGG